MEAHSIACRRRLADQSTDDVRKTSKSGILTSQKASQGFNLDHPGCRGVSQTHPDHRTPGGTTRGVTPGCAFRVPALLGSDSGVSTLHPALVHMATASEHGGGIRSECDNGVPQAILLCGDQKLESNLIRLSPFPPLFLVSTKYTRVSSMPGRYANIWTWHVRLAYNLIGLRLYLVNIQESHHPSSWYKHKIFGTNESYSSILEFLEKNPNRTAWEVAERCISIA
ncbi:hypothetical protein PGT21_015111 [Puccinia graminis f. sp. tritici]|uniref:Uncharacterized protein n=1 Tax=Puccinia graminis f. sp. tritici TaxID=56615 RepID=A0A5B0LV71_PUCGR|nr:hypothetical protein PGT21_015111 [Puccinia graminis f. sp. tritici]KAA1093547.1 hypothetical protein PGTUg99_026716 [Puccinia graminis f. sp. tritici]